MSVCLSVCLYVCMYVYDVDIVDMQCAIVHIMRSVEK